MDKNENKLNNPSSHIVPMNGNANIDCLETPNRKLQLDRKEYTRILIGALSDLGFRNAAASLEEEAKLSYETGLIRELRENILEGKWEEAVGNISSIEGVDKNTRQLLVYTVLRHQYDECLASKSVDDSVFFLRKKLSKVASLDQIQEASKLLLESSHPTVSRQSAWSSVRTNLPPELIVPENHLLSLLEQPTTQLAPGSLMSLWKDSSKSPVVSAFTCEQTLRDHDPRSEVWLVEFSSCGNYLVSAGNDYVVNVYKYDAALKRLDFLESLKAHESELQALAWARDNLMFASANTTGNIIVYRIVDDTVNLQFSIEDDSSAVLAMCFDDNNILIVSWENFFITMYNDSGVKVGEIKQPFNIYGIRFVKCRDLFIASCSGSTKVRFFVKVSIENSDETTDGEPSKLLELQQATIKDSPEFLGSLGTIPWFDTYGSIVSMVELENKILQWDIAKPHNKPIEYRGVDFGAAVFQCSNNGKRLACGSANGSIAIWSTKEIPSEFKLPNLVITGHTQPVSGVQWHPKHNNILVSASDDGTVRLWDITLHEAF